MEIIMVTATPDPLGVISWAKSKMLGKTRYQNEWTREEKEHEFIDCTKTLLTTPFEFVNFAFDELKISRAATHQVVRTRMASYVQESLRDVVKSGKQFEYLIPDSIKNNPEALEHYTNGMKNIKEDYEWYIAHDIPAEDARGELPTNILTGLAQGIDYRNLVTLAESRLCRQAQKEHRDILINVKRLITAYEPLMGEYLQPSCAHNGYCGWESDIDTLKCPLQKIYPFRSEVISHSAEIKSFLEEIKSNKKSYQK